eukprot:scaffold205217_cov27-Tisochrysis_lutea.AAC.1
MSKPFRPRVLTFVRARALRSPRAYMYLRPRLSADGRRQTADRSRRLSTRTICRRPGRAYRSWHVDVVEDFAS